MLWPSYLVTIYHLQQLIDWPTLTGIKPTLNTGSQHYILHVKCHHPLYVVFQSGLKVVLLVTFSYLCRQTHGYVKVVLCFYQHLVCRLVPSLCPFNLYIVFILYTRIGLFSSCWSCCMWSSLHGWAIWELLQCWISCIGVVYYDNTVFTSCF